MRLVTFYFASLMSNFLTYSNKLRQTIPALSPQQAEDYVNDAWRDIRDADDEWSFLHRTEYWLCPAIITCVGLTVTQNDDVVGLTVEAVGQLSGLNNPPLTVRQFRLNGGGGPVYGIAGTDCQQVTDGAINALGTTLTCASSAPFGAGDVGKFVIVTGAGPDGADLETTIVSFTSTTEVELADAATLTVADATVSWGSTLTLDRLYRETSDTDATAIVQRMYYQPEADMGRMDHITDNFVGYEFAFEIGPPDELDRIDPQRAAVGQPYRLFFHNFDPDTDKPVYEMWPAPQAERAYTVMYWERGSDFVEDDESLPVQIPEELLLIRARMLGYEWLMTATPDLKRLSAIGAMMEKMQQRYSSRGNPQAPLGLLERTRRKDHSTYRKAFIKRSRRGSWPVIDSRYLQQTDWGPSGALTPYYGG